MAKEGLYIWNVATGKRTHLFPVPQPEHEPFWHAPVRGCAFSPMENIVALPTGNGEVYFVDAEGEVGGKWQLAIARPRIRFLSVSDARPAVTFDFHATARTDECLNAKMIF